MAPTFPQGCPGTAPHPPVPAVPPAQLQLAPARGTTEALTIDAISAALLP